MLDDFSGAWTHDFNVDNLGMAIPLRPEAEKIFRERMAMMMTDHPFADTASRCLPIGTPGNMLGAPYPVQFVQRPEFIAILFEGAGTFVPFT